MPSNANKPLRARQPMSQHPLYGEWRRIIAASHTKSSANYAKYGKKGARVSREWRTSFWEFVGDVGVRPTGYQLDLIENPGVWDASNCVWRATTALLRLEGDKPLEPVCVCCGRPL